MNLPGAQKSQPGMKPELLATSFNVRKMSVSSNLIIWCLFFLVVIVELYTLYQYLYLNVVLTSYVENDTSTSVRVNLENYNKVTARLDAVAQYETPANIDFSGPSLGVGRQNPFADPE